MVRPVLLALVATLGLAASADPRLSQEPAPAAPVPAPAPSSAAPTSNGKLGFRPSIVLITVDTLRQDHLGCYGYFRDTSPRVDALVQESVLFERAIASMASTVPSHLTMLTGLYPHQHGKRSNRQSVREPFRSGEQCGSVARALADAGWKTAAFVSSVVLHARTGIGDGFQVFVHPALKRGPFDSTHTTDRALAWLEQEGKEGPFFLWVHYWDVHEPNVPEEPHASLFTLDEPLIAWMESRGVDPAHVEAVPPPDPDRPQKIGKRPGRAREKEAEAAPPKDVEPPTLGVLWNRYDACVREVDAEVGRLIDALRAQELLERSILVFTSDHGQSLGEHGAFGHGAITNVNTFVPLVVRFPAGVIPQPGRVSHVVSLADLMPTVLARFDEPALAGFFAQSEGTDVLAASFDRPYVLTQQALQFGQQQNPFVCGLYSGRWKYIQSDNAPEELYDLQGAGEFVDVLGSHPEVGAELEQILTGILARVPLRASGKAGAPEEVEALLEELEALGYAGDDE